MPGKLSDDEIRHRLEAHNYNVPAITDTTRSVLVKKLRQLDQQAVAASRLKAASKPSVDYSSAEEDFTPPVSSTRKNVGAMVSSARSKATASSGVAVGYYRNGRSGGLSGSSSNSYKVNSAPMYKSRVTPTSYTNINNSRVVNGGSLVNQSDDDEEEEEEEEEDDEEEEDESEADEDSDDKLEEYEEEITSIPRTDLATQTSFNSSNEQEQETRFRGKPIPRRGGASPAQYTLRSPHLRQNINKFGSLNEALSTLPTAGGKSGGLQGHASSSTCPTPVSMNTSTSRNLSNVHQSSSTPIVHQASPTTRLQHNNNNNNSMYSKQHHQFYNNRVLNSNSNSILISSLIVACAAIFFLYLGYKYINLSPPTTALLPPAASDKFPLCTGTEGKGEVNIKCIPGPQLNMTADLLQKLLAVMRPDDQQGCPESLPQAVFTVEELRTASGIQSDSEFAQLFQNILILFRHNFAWGIHPVTDDENNGHVTHLSVDTNRSIYCRLKGVVMFFLGLLYQAANYLLAGALIVAVVAAGWYGVKLWRLRKQREEQEMYALLEQVLTILQDNHAEKESMSGVGSPSFLAIVHIRDQLIAPQERASKARVWNKVAQYIRNNESRVREEVQHIHGEEFRVWQWLSDMPPKSPTSAATSPAMIKAYPGRVHTPVSAYNRGGGMPQTSSPMAMGHHYTPTSSGKPGGMNSSDMYNMNKSKDPWPYAPTTTAGSPGWQGSAFQLNRNVSAPVHPPTNCIKARHMFEHSPATLSIPDWTQMIRRDIVNRCKEAKILHIAVDKESKEGIVYIKALTMEDAGKVFSNLHGQWYKGQLVTAKYLREDRYHQRFPDSMNAQLVMK